MPACNGIIMRPGLAEMLHQERLWLLTQIKPGMDTQPFHASSRDRTYAVKLAYPQGFYKGGTILGGNDKKSIRLSMIRGKFREEAVIGNTGGSREPGRLADP